VVVWVVQRATHPVRRLSAELGARDEADLHPLQAAHTPRELQPVVEATNGLMQRLAQLLEHQKRFVRDASHQLRTPLAVLKTQLQSAQRGDVPPQQALAEISVTVQRATELANQMLALAKVEQLRHQGDAPVKDWAELARAVALDLAPLMAAGAIDFDIETQAAPVCAHEWALRELTRNLLHNAVKHTPAQGRLSLHIGASSAQATLVVIDSGPGIAPDQQQRLFQPFAAAGSQAGSGLGLAICREIVLSLGGTITLDNRRGTPGLEVTVQLPLEPSRHGH
jgi:two-component system, OmpR family, sensor histidine kinase TctE